VSCHRAYIGKGHVLSLVAVTRPRRKNKKEPLNLETTGGPGDMWSIACGLGDNRP
jgi:hypothetical protein